MLAIPRQVLNMFPMWQCEKCGYYFSSGLQCPLCGGARIPPDLFHDHNLMAKYAHEILMPKLPKPERDLLAQYFTVYFTSGFETEDNTFTVEWTGFVETNLSCDISVESANPHSGSKNAKAVVSTSVGDSALCLKTGLTASADGFIRFYLKLGTLPTNNGQTVGYAQLGNDTGTAGVIVVLQNTLGQYQWFLYTTEPPDSWNDGEAVYSNPTTGIYYCIEVENDTVGNSQKLWVDNSLRITASHNTTSTNTAVAVGIMSDFATAAQTAYIDDVAFGDARIGPLTGETIITLPKVGVGL